MTAFFTRYYKKSSFVSYFSSLSLASICLYASLALAGASSLHINNAEIIQADDYFLLNADMEIVFSSEVEQALNKGVPLNFLTEFQITTPRKYWFDDEIITISRSVTLSYHALSRQYLLTASKHQQSFSTLQEAKDELAHLKDWQVFDKSILKKNETYHAALRMRLDQSKLPKPLQVDAIGSEDWSMVSQRYSWTPVFNL